MNTEANTKLLTKQVFLEPGVKIFRVVDSEGTLIGGARPIFVDGGLMLEITLDAHTPEALDLDLSQAKLQVEAFIQNNDISGRITVG